MDPFEGRPLVVRKVRVRRLKPEEVAAIKKETEKERPF